MIAKQGTPMPLTCSGSVAMTAPWSAGYVVPKTETKCHRLHYFRNLALRILQQSFSGYPKWTGDVQCAMSCIKYITDLVITGVRRYFHPHDIFTPGWKYRYDIFTPSTIFISNGKSFCSQISLNFIMCIYNKEPFLYFLWLFTDFCSSQTVDTIH